MLLFEVRLLISGILLFYMKYIFLNCQTNFEVDFRSYFNINEPNSLSKTKNKIETKSNFLYKIVLYKIRPF